MMGPSAHPGKKLSPPQTARTLNPKTVKPQPQIAHPPKTLDIYKSKRNHCGHVYCCEAITLSSVEVQESP